MSHQFYSFRTWMRMILANANQEHVRLKIDPRVANLLAEAYADGVPPTVKATASWNCWETASFLSGTDRKSPNWLLDQAA
jgi:hypothetical protein